MPNLTFTMPHVRKFILIDLYTICLCAALFSLAPLRAQTPLPDDMKIVSPPSTVAQDAAAFSGAWLGAWGGELPTALVVERVRSNGTARVIYSWGDPTQ